MGHTVEVFTLDAGEFAEHFNVKVHGHVDSLDDSYDVLLINHNTCLDAVQHIKGKKIFTCHGVAPSLEQPKKGADVYVAISEKTFEHIASWKPVLIRNGIDTERFKPIKPLRETPHILVVSDWKEPYDKISKLSNHVTWIGKHNARFDIENVIQERDIVVSIGRGRYEAMSSGRVCLAYDERPYIGPKSQGLVTPENIETVIKQDYWNDGLEPTMEHLEKELGKYNTSLGEWGRKVIVDRFNAVRVAEQYLSL